MLSKLIEVGNRVELQETEHGKTAENEHKLHQSEVYDLLSEDRLEITMPIEQGKLVLMEVDAEYTMIFYTQNGLYQCDGRVIDRYKSENVYLLLIELTGKLSKHQRRDYYRYNCALDLGVRLLTEEEIEASAEGDLLMYIPNLELSQGMIVDISGGGLRFTSKGKFEKESLIYCTYVLSVQGKAKRYEVSAKILHVKELENHSGIYEYRVKFDKIEMAEREEIIRYIFEEERKERRKAWDK